MVVLFPRRLGRIARPSPWLLFAIFALLRVRAGSARLVVNELEINQPGTDTTEWVEIYNDAPCGSAPVDLGNFTVRHRNQASTSMWTEQLTPGFLLEPKGFYVLCLKHSASSCDQVRNGVSLQQGPDDCVEIENDSTGSTIIEDKACWASDSDTVDESLSRYPDGRDTGSGPTNTTTDAADFARSCATPGSANTADTSCSYNCADRAVPCSAVNIAPVACGLQLHLAADQLPGGLVDGDNVTTWPDLSGNGRHAIASPGAGGYPKLLTDSNAFCPGQVPSAIGPCLGLKAVTWGLSSANTIGSFAFPEIANVQTAFWVLAESVYRDSAARPLLGHSADSFFKRGQNLELWRAGAHEAVLRGSTTVNAGVVNATVAQLQTESAGMAIVAMRATGGPDLASGNTVYKFPRAETLAQDRTNSSSAWHGTVAEVLLFDRLLNDTETDLVGSYLKYKLQIWAANYSAVFATTTGTTATTASPTSGSSATTAAVPPPAPITTGAQTTGSGLNSGSSSSSSSVPPPATTGNKKAGQASSDILEDEAVGGLTGFALLAIAGAALLIILFGTIAGLLLVRHQLSKLREEGRTATVAPAANPANPLVVYKDQIVGWDDDDAKDPEEVQLDEISDEAH